MHALSIPSPLVLVVVEVVDLALGAHDGGHLLQQQPVVALDSRKPLFLELSIGMIKRQVILAK